MRASGLLRFILCSVLLATMYAFAAEVYVNCGTVNGTIGIDVSNPGTDSAVNCTAPAGRHAIEYKVKSQSLISGNLLNVKFTGAAFNGSQVNVCANTNPPTTVATAIPPSGTTIYNFLIGNTVLVDAYIYLTSDTCGGTANGTLTLLKQLNNLPGGANVKISAFASGNIPLDAPGSANLFSLTGSCNVKSFSPSVHNFDHLGGTKTINIASTNGSAGNTTNCLWYASDVQEKYWDSSAGNYAYRTPDWVTINNWSGVGSGTISYNVAAFNNIGSRRASIVLFGSSNFYITQVGLDQSNLAVTKTGTGTGDVTASPGTLSWSDNVGTASYISGTQVTLTATATGGSVFWGWTGDCSGTSNTCVLSLDTSKSVNAIFYSPSSNCNYTIEPLTKKFGKTKGTGRFSVKKPTDTQCETTDQDWVVVNDASGNWVQFAYDCGQNICYSNTFSGRGNQVVTYRVLENQTGSNRASQISTSLSPQTYSVQQSGSTCTSCDITFTDVPSNHWAKDYINAIACAGITVGCGPNIFCPDNYVTNGQFTAFLLRSMEGEPPDLYCYNGGGWFLDNQIGYVFCNYTRRLAELGIIRECTNGYFCPNNFINRATIAEYVTKGLGYSLDDNYCSSGSPFNDVSPSHPQCKYIKKLYELGIITGCGGGMFCPNDLATRAEMAKFLYMAFLRQSCP